MCVLIFYIVKIRCDSPDIYPFWICSAFNPYCSIHMNWHDGPWFTVIMSFCFAEDTIFPYKYFTTNFIIIIYSWVVFMFSVKISSALPVVSNFVPVSYVGDVEQQIPSKYCCTWGGVKYWMVGRANGPSQVGSLGATEVAMSISAVQSIIIMTWCTCSSIAFTWGFLTLVGLRLMPYESHKASKWSLNSLPLS